MYLTPLLITAGILAFVALMMTSLYYLLSRFRPPIHQISPPPPPPPPKSTAADLKKVLGNIPVVYYTKSEEVRECSVCLSSVEEGEKVRFLPDCGHGFHARCIDEWLCSQLSCPCCRSLVKSPAKPAEVESSTSSLSLQSIKMAFWRGRGWQSSSGEDDRSNGGGESSHEREESSPV